MTKAFILFILLFISRLALCQTFAFIDSDYILSSIPEYAESKEKLDKLAETWTKEIEDRFGVLKTEFLLNGDYFLKRQELIKPIQDRIYTAMKKVAKAEGYTFVFDKSNQSNLIYADKDADISNSVLEEMGITKE
ncbi:MAG: OmpH family outer membrane protein [Flavobacteriia bacterium]|nr:OmpH family outer membrane protein [Flavobacteriia bacterium]